MPAPFEAFFLPADQGHRFCIFHPAQCGTERGSVVYVHPFAEEMNKSRRMAALQSRALAQAGYAVLQIDLLGCGDSSGDFGDATWDGWVDDVVLGCRWLRAQSRSPLWLWGLRGGCLLAAQAASRLDEPSRLLFWQPALAGKMLLQQFLRLRVASDSLGGQAKGASEALRAQLAGGDTIEAAGYRLAPALAFGLEQSSLEPCMNAQRLEWIDVSTRPQASTSSLTQETLSRWQRSAGHVRWRSVMGPAFWQTTEIEEAPALLADTIDALTEPAAA